MRLLLLNLLVIVFGWVSLQAQESSLLSSGNKNKIERADRKINKAESIVDKKEKYADKIKEAEESGSKRKLKRYKTKANRIIITSASYYKEGYTKKYKAYKSASSKAVKEGNLSSDAITLLSEAKDEYKFGRKMRRKSSNESDVNTAVEYLFDANKSQGSAIDNLVKALGKDVEVVETSEEITEEETPVAVTDSIIDQSDIPVAPVAAVTAGVLLVDSVPQQSDSLMIDTLATDSLATDSLAMDTLAIVADSTITKTDSLAVTPVVVSEEVVPQEEGIPNLYFSVQFLAEKQPVPKEKILSLYDGPFEVVKHEADGWFRYSFGRFKTLEEANQMKERSGIKGYVVAYLDEERISTRRAEEMIQASNE